MTKSRRTVSLDEENDQYLDADGINASSLVNRLVRSYRSAGGDETGMLRLREQQLESEVAELESRLEAKRRELDSIRDQLSTFEDTQQSVLEEAAETISPQARSTDNPAVENWANKADLPPEEFLDRLDDVDGGDET